MGFSNDAQICSHLMSKTSAELVFGRNYSAQRIFASEILKMKRFSRELRRLSKPEENDKGKFVENAAGQLL